MDRLDRDTTGLEIQVMKKGKGIFLLLFLLMCKPPDPPQGNFPNLITDVFTEDTASFEEISVSGEPLKPDGIWLLWTETVSCITVLGVEVEGLAHSLEIVRLSDEGNGIVRHEIKTCAILQSPIVGLITIIPGKLIESLPVTSYLAILDGGEVGDRYTTQIYSILWGMELDDPLNDPLPDKPDDPRVFDMDNDGNPGVTLMLGDNLCSMFAVQRSISQWKGEVASGTEIKGGGISMSEQKILKATSGFCASPYEVRFLSDQNRFALRRIDGKHGAVNLDYDGDGEITCAEVAEYGITPFSPREPDDNNCKLF